MVKVKSSVEPARKQVVQLTATNNKIRKKKAKLKELKQQMYTLQGDDSKKAKMDARIARLKAGLDRLKQEKHEFEKNLFNGT
jgi:hypothetical protein